MTDDEKRAFHQTRVDDELKEYARSLETLTSRSDLTAGDLAALIVKIEDPSLRAVLISLILDRSDLALTHLKTVRDCIKDNPELQETVLIKLIQDPRLPVDSLLEWAYTHRQFSIFTDKAVDAVYETLLKRTDVTYHLDISEEYVPERWRDRVQAAKTALEERGKLVEQAARVGNNLAFHAARLAELPK